MGSRIPTIYLDEKAGVIDRAIARIEEWNGEWKRDVLVAELRWLGHNAESIGAECRKWIAVLEGEGDFNG